MRWSDKLSHSVLMLLQNLSQPSGEGSIGSNILILFIWSWPCARNIGTPAWSPLFYRDALLKVLESTLLEGGGPQQKISTLVGMTLITSCKRKASSSFSFLLYLCQCQVSMPVRIHLDPCILPPLPLCKSTSRVGPFGDTFQVSPSF